MANSFASGQALALDLIRVPSPYAWGPNTQVFVRSSVHEGNFGVRVQALYWDGAGNIVVKDAHGVEFFSGATTGPTQFVSGFPYVTIAAPLQITDTSGSSGTIYFYGEIL